MEHDSQRGVASIDTGAVAAAILQAAGWARVGITMPDEMMRERAAAELAQAIVEQINPQPRPDPRQLALRW
ncbi:DUF6771 family protein [Novosphingobium sp. 9U]|uniref:DUF6771 family protein n=1 Tax=Novosphingobium sp. 9U TaxID=2653158 RepID=UPI0012EEED11|nr:DUF6771 family protein [Novosphingobium sp. 9U]VWX48733.1 conserved hypothetical protein [Novosphingobium sp. 9U]